MDTCLTRSTLGRTWNESDYSLYELKNSAGISVQISDLGATIVSLKTLNRQGVPGEIMLGYDTPEQYLASNGYFGASVGRVTNRIEDGRFVLDDKVYQLPLNSGDHCLHGGPTGFHCQKWTLEHYSEQCLVLSLLSADGDNGFPGNLKVCAEFELNEAAELLIRYRAESDQATPINLTSHGYFNLADQEETILDHQLMIAADSYLTVDDRLIPNYQVPVADTAFDFTEQKLLRPQMMCYDKQLFTCGGFDHNYCLNTESIAQLAARVYSPESGRFMELYTNLPGIQFYTANHLEGEAGKSGLPMTAHAGLCLEPQLPPNSINAAEPESAILRPGELYTAEIKLKFGVE